jgi:O-antigen/teichoic acid export membrane protein
MGYLKNAVKNLSWLTGFRLYHRGLTLARTAILARLLLPHQFGIYGIATLILAFVEILTETGINAFLIQEEESLKKYLNTAWVVSIARGVITFLLIFFLSHFIAKFFNNPDAFSILRIISFVALIRGFINPARVSFQKDLELNKDFWFNSSILTVETLVVVFLSWQNPVASSLAWGLIASAILEVIFSFVFIKPWPKFSIQFPQLKRIVNKGKWLTSAGIFNYLASQGDDIVVGKLLAPAYLGLYQMAYKLSTLPVSEIGDTVGKVSFPVYVKIQGDKERLKKAYLKTLFGITTLVIPAGFLFYFFPELIINLVLGNNWLEAAPTLKALALYGVVRAISGSASSLFLSLKLQKYLTLTTFTRFTILAIFIFPLTIKFGIVGSAYACLLSALLTFPLVFYLVNRVFKSA